MSVMCASYRIPRRLAAALLAAGLVLAAGCASGPFRLKQPPAPAPVVTDERAEAIAYYQRLEFRAASTAFARGSYKSAAGLYGSVAETSADAGLARDAAFGRICSLLAGAGTPEAAKTALAAFTAWAGDLPEELSGQDPRMLAPSLKRVPEALELKNELAAERKRRNEAERKLEATKRQLQSREAQMSKLNKQLEELEALHQSLETKKRELIP
jgi:hypothetical protein